MHDELILSPFDRAIVGMQGAILLRRNDDHAKRCAKAIRNRRQPGWSQQQCGFTVEQGAAQ